MSMWTSIERHYFRRPDGLWQEVFLHNIKHKRLDGTVETRLDKKQLGKVYREVGLDSNLHSANGEVLWTDPQSNRQIKLLALSNNQQG